MGRKATAQELDEMYEHLLEQFAPNLQEQKMTTKGQEHLTQKPHKADDRVVVARHTVSGPSSWRNDSGQVPTFGEARWTIPADTNKKVQTATAVPALIKEPVHVDPAVITAMLNDQVNKKKARRAPKRKESELTVPLPRSKSTNTSQAPVFEAGFNPAAPVSEVVISNQAAVSAATAVASNAEVSIPLPRSQVTAALPLPRSATKAGRVLKPHELKKQGITSQGYGLTNEEIARSAASYVRFTEVVGDDQVELDTIIAGVRRRQNYIKPRVIPTKSHDENAFRRLITVYNKKKRALHAMLLWVQQNERAKDKECTPVPDNYEGKVVPEMRHAARLNQINKEIREHEQMAPEMPERTSTRTKIVTKRENAEKEAARRRAQKREARSQSSTNNAIVAQQVTSKTETGQILSEKEIRRRANADARALEEEAERGKAAYLSGNRFTMKVPKASTSTREWEKMSDKKKRHFLEDLSALPGTAAAVLISPWLEEMVKLVLGFILGPVFGVYSWVAAAVLFGIFEVTIKITVGRLFSKTSIWKAIYVVAGHALIGARMQSTIALGFGGPRQTLRAVVSALVECIMIHFVHNLLCHYTMMPYLSAKTEKKTPHFKMEFPYSALSQYGIQACGVRGCRKVAAKGQKLCCDHNPCKCSEMTLDEAVQVRLCQAAANNQISAATAAFAAATSPEPQMPVPATKAADAVHATGNQHTGAACLAAAKAVETGPVAQRKPNYSDILGSSTSGTSSEVSTGSTLSSSLDMPALRLVVEAGTKPVSLVDSATQSSVGPEDSASQVDAKTELDGTTFWEIDTGVPVISRPAKWNGVYEYDSWSGGLDDYPVDSQYNFEQVDERRLSAQLRATICAITDRPRFDDTHLIVRVLLWCAAVMFAMFCASSASRPCNWTAHDTWFADLWNSYQGQKRSVLEAAKSVPLISLLLDLETSAKEKPLTGVLSDLDAIFSHTFGVYRMNDGVHIGPSWLDVRIPNHLCGLQSPGTWYMGAASVLCLVLFFTLKSRRMRKLSKPFLSNQRLGDINANQNARGVVRATYIREEIEATPSLGVSGVLAFYVLAPVILLGFGSSACLCGMLILPVLCTWYSSYYRRRTYGYINLPLLIALRGDFIGDRESVKKTITALKNRTQTVEATPGLNDTTLAWAFWFYEQSSTYLSN